MSSMLYLNSWTHGSVKIVNSSLYDFNVISQCYISTHGSVIANSSLYDFNVISEHGSVIVPAYMTSHGSVIANSSLYDFNVISQLMDQ